MEKREEFKNNLNSPAAEEFTNPDDPSISAFSNSNINYLLQTVAHDLRTPVGNNLSLSKDTCYNRTKISLSNYSSRL
jgi:hypothetical protein